MERLVHAPTRQGVGHQEPVQGYPRYLGSWYGRCWYHRMAQQVSLNSLVTFRARLLTTRSLCRHQSTAQKVVQARMWAQGLTIGVMVAAGILTHQQRQEAAQHRVSANSDLASRSLTEQSSSRAMTITPGYTWLRSTRKNSSSNPCCSLRLHLHPHHKLSLRNSLASCLGHPS